MLIYLMPKQSVDGSEEAPPRKVRFWIGPIQDISFALYPVGEYELQ